MAQSKPFSIARRRWLQGLGGTLLLGAGGWSLAKPWLVNPCRSDLPPELFERGPLKQIWTGIDPAQVWDCHVHIAGTGDGGSGIEIGPQLSSPWYPLQYAQRLFYMNAGCAHDAPGKVDASYAARLENLVAAMPAGVKLMLFAFERFHDEAGKAQPERSAFYVPNAYAQKLAQQHPSGFEWVASIHPYRADAVEALKAAIAGGAKAVKWLPAAMGMNPASSKCDAYYRVMAAAKLPLIVHCGEEKAVKGADTQHLGNPLLLRRALDAGVRIVVAHCATMGEDLDIDAGSNAGKVPSFDLFTRLMAEPRSRDLLHGDISAIVLRNRKFEVIQSLLQRTDWHGRLLYGSDYPLPGILPLISTSAFVNAGMLPAEAVADLETLREHHPLLFDFALKRLLSWQSKAFSAQVFETRRFFEGGK